ncbi:MAG: hypothetical protein WCL71_09780 [Deltaproteobacteria bacterium]
MAEFFYPLCLIGLLLALGSQMGQVISNSASSTTVDVNRYRGMMGGAIGGMMR